MSHFATRYSAFLQNETPTPKCLSLWKNMHALPMQDSEANKNPCTRYVVGNGGLAFFPTLFSHFRILSTDFLHKDMYFGNNNESMGESVKRTKLNSMREFRNTVRKEQIIQK